MIGVGWVVTLDGKTATVSAIDGNRVTLDDGRSVTTRSLEVAK